MNEGKPDRGAIAWLLRPAIQIGLILLVGSGLYWHTMNFPFVFDDNLCIVANPAIRNIKFFFNHDLVRALHLPYDIQNSFALRPVVYLTFYLNYLAGGLQVFGYHLFNTVLHLANAVLIYLLFAVTLRLAPLEKEGDVTIPWSRILPLLVALFFVTHPLQTQAVTYTVQRFTSLVACFYLAALLLYIQARIATASAARWSFYFFSLFATILAMKSKETAFTLPGMLLLYELFFLSGTLRQRCCWLLPFFLTMTIIPLTLLGLSATEGASFSGQAVSESMNLVNFAEVSRWDYLKTQFGVIVTYLGMLIVPIRQNFDHDYRLAQSFFAPKVLGSFLFLLALFAGALGLAFRSFKASDRSAERLFAFGILWFFVTLSVESSIIPIDDLLVEYRVYLPSFGFFLALAAVAVLAVNNGIFSFRVLIGSALVVLVLLASATFARNSLYRDPIALYRDVVEKSPDKPRAHSLLGVAYLVNERPEEALLEFVKVLQLRPDDAYTMINLGNVYFNKGEFDAAIQQFQRSLELVPDNYLAHANLGMCYLNLARMAEAERELLAALKINVNFKEGRSCLAHLYELLGRNDEAVAQYLKLLAFFPKDQDARERLQSLTGSRYQGEGVDHERK